MLDDAPDGRSVVVTGSWSAEAAEVLERGEADGLVLNYARGFSERGLDFLDRGLGVRRLNVLDRQIIDLAPIERLGGSLEELSVQAAPDAELDLGVLPHLRSVAGEWALIGGSLGAVDELQSVTTWQFDEADLHAFRDHVGLQRLTIKEAPYLESLSGVGELREFAALSILLARRLVDIGELLGLGSSLRRLELQGCPAITALDDVGALVNLHFLGISECGDIDSLAPVASLEHLETFHAWGSTRVIDGNLSPLAQLPRLKEVRMRSRRTYNPRVVDVVPALPS